MLLLFLILFFMHGVSAETEAVMEGDSVTLHTNLSDIRNDDTILWLYGPKDSVLSQITRKNDFTSFFVTDDDVRFRGRLQVDQNTGSLTIRNTRITHSGQYKLSISRVKTTKTTFNVTVFGVVGKTDGVTSVSVKEGESVTLNTDVEVQRDDLIVWRFGDEGILLAKIDVGTKENSLNDADERFRDRLKLDQTGSLTIKNTGTKHAGLYELQIRGRESSQRFLLSVTVPDPALSPGGIAGISVVVLLVLVVVVIYYRYKISKLEEQVAKNKKVEEGGSLCLPTGVTKLHKEDKVQWYYKDEREDILIAKINEETSTYGTDVRFINKLSLDPETGNLTINYIENLQAGLYRLKIKSKMRTKHNGFIVIVTDEDETQSGAEGKHVLLKTGVNNIQTGDLILWTFGLKNCLVARADSRTAYIDERFSGRLELDKKTGSLTIKNISKTEYGHYKLQIIRQEQTTFRRFIVLEPAEPKSEAEGQDVTLETGVNNIQTGALILWMFGAKNCLVARTDSGTGKTYFNERFRDRLELNETTGSLTIKNITNTEYGHYKLQIINKEKTTFRRFNVLEPDDQANEKTTLMNQEKKYDVLVLQDISE
ncbi:hypothetical protein R3I94_017892 [Phoxinus phoxinus]